MAGPNVGRIISVATANSNIDRVIGVPYGNVKAIKGVGGALLSVAYGFDDQTTNVSATGNGWSPSGSHSDWVNGASAVKNFKNGGKWSSTTQTPINGQPSLVGSNSITGWKCDYNTTSSTNTGPNGAHNGSGGHNNGTSTKYVYTEVSSSRHSYHHIMRTPAINFSTDMGDTDNTLELEFYVHARGINIGVLTVWIDDASASNSTDATLLAQLSGSHSGTASGGTTTLSSAATTHAQISLGGTANGSATFTGTGSDWVKAVINLGDYKTVNSDHYIYFVYAGKTSFTGDLAVDDVVFKES